MLGQSELHLDLNSIKEVAKSNLCEGAFYLPPIKTDTMQSKNHLSKEDNLKEYLPQCTLSNNSPSLQYLDTNSELDMCLNTLNQSLFLDYPQNSPPNVETATVETVGYNTKKEVLSNGHDIVSLSDKSESGYKCKDNLEYKLDGEEESFRKITNDVHELDKSSKSSSCEKFAKESFSKRQDPNSKRHLIPKAVTTEVDEIFRTEVRPHTQLQYILGSKVVKGQAVSNDKCSSHKVAAKINGNLRSTSSDIGFHGNGNGHVGVKFNSGPNGIGRCNGYLKGQGVTKSKKGHLIGNGSYSTTKSVTPLNSKPIPNGHTVLDQIGKSKNRSKKRLHKKNVEGVKINEMEDTHRHNGGRVFKT